MVPLSVAVLTVPAGLHVSAIITVGSAARPAQLRRNRNAVKA